MVHASTRLLGLQVFQYPFKGCRKPPNVPPNQFTTFLPQLLWYTRITGEPRFFRFRFSSVLENWSKVHAIIGMMGNLTEWKLQKPLFWFTFTCHSCVRPDVYQPLPRTTCIESIVIPPPFTFVSTFSYQSGCIFNNPFRYVCIPPQAWRQCNFRRFQIPRGCTDPSLQNTNPVWTSQVAHASQLRSKNGNFALLDTAQAMRVTFGAQVSSWTHHGLTSADIIVLISQSPCHREWQMQFQVQHIHVFPLTFQKSKRLFAASIQTTGKLVYSP